MKVGSLFAGIGGFDLGFERAGFEIAWQVEIDPYCKRVLQKHWPDVRRHDDIRTFDGWPADIICGGFPCQDLSSAGAQEGIDGPRTGLWREMVRVVGEVRPQYVVMENVPRLLIRGFGKLVREMAKIGYCVEWDCIPAYYVGSPQIRDRAWVVSYADGGHDIDDMRAEMASNQVSEIARDADNEAQPGDRINEETSWLPRVPESLWSWPDPPGGLGVVDGIPNRVDRLRGLGNAIVPQIAEWIARRIAAIDGA